MVRRAIGFTLVEILVAIFIISVLLMIAVPNFVRARDLSQARSCVQNLRQIVVAKEQYAMDNHLAAGATMPALSVFCGLGGYIKQEPLCPSSGTYSVNDLGANPTCTIGGTGPNAHVLP